jgi:phosphoglycolate phosphatase-like HAD superfamily hydrolase
VPEDNKIKCKDDIIQLYSSMCKKLYLEADITPGFLSFINSLSGKKYIASGSEQEELRSVFLQRGLDSYFDRIYGSPVAKKDNVKTILEIESTKNAIMFGDAISDLDSAYTNSINFCAYIPFSNVPVELTEKSNKYNFPVINSWAELGLK